jgi:ADP-heptose:LPS heptosyltransferase
MSGADFLASYETLMRYLAPTEDAILRGFSPLKADPPQIERLRNTYCSSNESRLVGISWTSTNQKKDLPPLTEWARLLGRTGAKFVSIQYSPNKEDLEALGASSGKPVLYDETVDSLANLDLSAAQIAAMDAVVTISNTAAHMAGALGVRTFVIVDDKQHLFWPVSGETTPWYPHTTIIRREGRDWGAVIDQVAKLLSAYLAGAGRN